MVLLPNIPFWDQIPIDNLLCGYFYIWLNFINLKDTLGEIPREALVNPVCLKIFYVFNLNESFPLVVWLILCFYFFIYSLCP